MGLAVAFERLVTLPPAAALDDVNQIRPTFEKFGRAAVAQAMRGMVRDAEQPLRGREKRAKIGTGQRENVLGADSGPSLAEIKEPASQPTPLNNDPLVTSGFDGLAESSIPENQRNAACTRRIATVENMTQAETLPILTAEQAVVAEARDQSSFLYTLPKQSNNDASPCFNTNGLSLLLCAETFPALQRAIGVGEEVRMFWIRMQKSMKKVSSALNADVPLVARSVASWADESDASS